MSREMPVPAVRVVMCGCYTHVLASSSPHICSRVHHKLALHIHAVLTPNWYRYIIHSSKCSLYSPTYGSEGFYMSGDTRNYCNSLRCQDQHVPCRVVCSSATIHVHICLLHIHTCMFITDECDHYIPHKYPHRLYHSCTYKHRVRYDCT